MNAEPTQRIIPLGAHVQCADGYGGSVTHLIVEALVRRLTHIVVQDSTASGVEHLVPVAWIVGTTRDSVTLDCTQDTLAALEPFAEERYISSNASAYEPFYALDPFAEFEAEHIPLVGEHIEVWPNVFYRSKASDRNLQLIPAEPDMSQPLAPG